MAARHIINWLINRVPTFCISVKWWTKNKTKKRELARVRNCHKTRFPKIRKSWLSHFLTWTKLSELYCTQSICSCWWWPEQPCLRKMQEVRTITMLWIKVLFHFRIFLLNESSMKWSYEDYCTNHWQIMLK